MKIYVEKLNIIFEYTFYLFLYLIVVCFIIFFFYLNSFIIIILKKRKINKRNVCNLVQCVKYCNKLFCNCTVIRALKYIELSSNYPRQCNEHYHKKSIFTCHGVLVKKVNINRLLQMDGNGWSLGRILAGRKPVFLYRNVRQWRKRTARMMSASMPNTMPHPEKGAE